MMKTLLPLLFVTLGCMSLHVQAAASAQDKMRFCSKVYDVAESVMQERQNGVSFKQALTPVLEQKNVDVRNLQKDMVTKAYQTPIKAKDVEKNQAVQQFAEKYATLCLELASK